jgi:hypothetical protein
VEGAGRAVRASPDHCGAAKAGAAQPTGGQAVSTPVVPFDQYRAMITEQVASSNFLDGVVFRLFQNNINPTQAIVLSQLVEADYDGYAPVGPVAWGTPWTDAAGNGVTSGSTAGFYCTGSDTPNLIYGYYVTHGPTASETLKWCERFDNPLPMQALGNAVTLPVVWALPGPVSIVPEQATD